MATVQLRHAWPQVAVCVGFALAGAYIIAGTIFAAPSLAVEANYLSMGVNCLAFAVLGAGCLLWPYLSSLVSKPSDTKHDDGPPGATEAPASNEDVEAAQAETDAAAPKPKRAKVYYLTHMKTILTFVVVTHHVVGSFGQIAGDGTGGIQTSADPSSVLYKVSGFILGADQNYFMAAFFLVSGIFCPKSLDRKGFRDYVLDKLVRLGGPFIIYFMVLGPLLNVWTRAYAGLGVGSYSPNPGTTWFVFWLLNYSILYAIIAQVMPVIRFKMPNSVLLTVGGFVFGVVYCAVNMTPLGGGAPWNGFDLMNQWQYGLSIYIPFFAAGVIGGRNGWLESIESMSRWCKWTLRVIVGGLLLLQLLDNFHVLPWNPEGLGWLWNGLFHGVYPVGMTLMQMQLFHEFLNINTKFLGAVGVAAYAVYVIQPWFLAFWTMIYIEILKAAHVPISFAYDDYFVIFCAATCPASTGENKYNPKWDTNEWKLGSGILFGGIITVFVLAQLTVWPAAYYLRKLPVLNKML